MLSKKDIKLIPRSFDFVGDILVFADFPEELIKKEREVGAYLLGKFNNVKVVARKTGNFAGKFRLQKLKIIAGERRTETVFKENNCIFKVDLQKCYFTGRLGNERLRICNQVRRNEIVLTMFSGIGIYPIEISKNSKAGKIYGVELNPTAYEYAIDNLARNKINNVLLIKGDVKRIVPKLQTLFDRIIMPLPKDAYNFLDIGLLKIKRGGIIHLYDFLKEEEIKTVGVQKIKDALGKFDLKRIVKCGQISPGKFRVCFDIRILKARRS